MSNFSTLAINCIYFFSDNFFLRNRAKSLAKKVLKYKSPKKLLKKWQLLFPTLSDNFTNIDKKSIKRLKKSIGIKGSDIHENVLSFESDRKKRMKERPNVTLTWDLRRKGKTIQERTIYCTSNISNYLALNSVFASCSVQNIAMSWRLSYVKYF